MKILVLGHAKHGKDTAAELIAQETGLNFLSSSQAALDLIRPALIAATGITDSRQLFESKFQHRALWYELIRLLNLSDPTTLTRYVLRISDLYIGMRSHIELAATKDFFNHIIWVDGSERKPAEPQSSMTIKYDPGYMVKLDNNGNHQDLIQNVKQLVVDLRLRVI